MRKRFLVIATLIIVAAVGIWYLVSPQPDGGHKGTLSADIGSAVGKTLPSFTMADLSGHDVSVGRSDKIVVINFWATWCPPCLAELPELNRFAEKHKADVAFYAIDIQESSSKVADFMQRNGYRLPVLLDKDGSTAKTFRVSAIPTTIVVDRSGIIQFRKSGGITMEELESVIKGL